MSNINIEGRSLVEVINSLDNDIAILDKILKNIYKATTTLDESKWQAPEKKKFDSEYLPYCKVISTEIPTRLKESLNLVTKALTTYQELNEYLTKEAHEKLDDFSSNF